MSVPLMSCVLCSAPLRPAVIDWGDLVGEEAPASVHGDVFRQAGKTGVALYGKHSTSPLMACMRVLASSALLCIAFPATLQ